VREIRLFSRDSSRESDESSSFHPFCLPKDKRERRGIREDAAMILDAVLDWQSDRDRATC
jgi:hypothetical protein